MLKNVLNNPYILFTWSFILLVSPNLVFGFINSQDTPSWNSALLISSIYVLCLIAFKHIGLVVALLAPLFIINGVQLVMVILFGGGAISTSMWLNFVSSNTSETEELMSTLWPWVLLAGAIFIPVIAWGVIAYKHKLHCSTKFRAIVLGCIILAMPFSITELSLLSSTYPFNTCYNLSLASIRLYNFYQYPTHSAKFTFNACKTDSTSSPEIVVLVIGETTRAASWQLNGYSRATTPQLAQRNDIINYTNVTSQANITHRIVPILLTRANASHYDRVYHEKSVITAFKEAGFETYFITNQGMRGSFIEYYANESNHIIELRKLLTPPIYDAGLLPHIQQAINNSTRNTLIVIHTYGSHFEYNARYPIEYTFYSPHTAPRLTIENKAAYINGYDNTIRYVDTFLNQIIEQLNTSKKCASMLYISDHGEDLMDDDRRLVLHCSPTPSYYQLHIPMIMWFSPQHQQHYPSHLELCRKHALQPISSDAIFHTLIDMGGITTTLQDPSFSVINALFTTRPRHYIDDHDYAIPLNRLPDMAHLEPMVSERNKSDTKKQR